jgi:hypothetical protein
MNSHANHVDPILKNNENEECILKNAVLPCVLVAIKKIPNLYFGKLFEKVSTKWTITYEDMWVSSQMTRFMAISMAKFIGISIFVPSGP